MTRDKQGWITEYDGRKVERISSLGVDPRLPGVLPYCCINIKGTNGSGKSTVPMYMIKSEQDDDVVYLTLNAGDKEPVAMYCKTYNTVLIGRYKTGVNCGGCDALGNTQIVKLVLSRLWKRPVHILYEGIIVGDIRETFYQIMLGFNTVYERKLGFCFMGTRFAECLKRIQRRNGGKEVKTELVKGKYQNSVKHLRHYLAEGKVPCTVLRTDCSRQEVFERFLSLYPDLQPTF